MIDFADKGFVFEKLLYLRAYGYLIAQNSVLLIDAASEQVRQKTTFDLLKGCLATPFCSVHTLLGLELPVSCAEI